MAWMLALGDTRGAAPPDVFCAEKRMQPWKEAQ